MTEPTHSSMNPLCVDLDGTLVRTDLLYEQLVVLIKRNPLALLFLLFSLLRGKAAFKAGLADRAGGELDVANLPYDDEVVAHIRRNKDMGRRVELVSGSHETVVARVARHLDLFDDWLGSHDGRNLTGKTKARLLGERHPGGFAYIGNGAADLPVWAASAEALLAQAPSDRPRLARKIKGLGIASKRPVGRWTGFIRALRMHQWAKNGLIFLPLLLTLSDRTGWADVIACAIGFGAFCLMSSGSYFLNDILDVQADRRHPTKKTRAVAAGAISIRAGAILGLGLIAAGFALGYSLSSAFVWVMGAYMALTLSYSFLFKRLIALDVLTISVLFLLRADAGGVAIDRPVTVWLAAFLLFFFLALAIGKRVIELRAIDDLDARDNGRAYRTEDADVMTATGVTMSIASVMLFLIYAILEQHSFYSNDWAIILTVGLLAYWVLRFWILIHRDRIDMDPVAFVLRDPATLVTLVAIMAIALAEQLPRIMS